MPANSQSSIDNAIAEAAINTSLYYIKHYVKQIQYIEKLLVIENKITKHNNEALKAHFDSVTYYAMRLKTEYSIDTIKYTKHLTQIPSKFNEFSTQAYISLLKDKYAT